MRDPQRIDRLIEEVRKVWKKYPDLRMAQLFEYIEGMNEGPVDPYYLEDDEWEQILKDRTAGEGP